MAAESPFRYLNAILPSLPSDFANKIRTFCGSSHEPSAEYVLDTLIRFICGAECAANLTDDAHAEWSEKQRTVCNTLQEMVGPKSIAALKRPREDELEAEPRTQKRQKQTEEGPHLQDYADAIYTLHSVSTTSPIRKKVDITIHREHLRLTHPTTHTIEATIPLSAVARAFLLPTRGKTKAHWTVVILPSGASESSKPLPDSLHTASQQQIIFGVDAIISSPWSTTTHTSPSAKPDPLPKGSETRPVLINFLSKLDVQLIEPSTDVFKSACGGISSGISASETGIPGVEAYRGTKAGSLWFMKEGLLWGESKPCEFWAVEDLIGKSEGLRVIGANGRTCTIVLTRKSGEEVGDDEEDVGVETQLSLVDSRERPGIEGWVKVHRHLFGKKLAAVGPEGVANGQIDDDEDDEDEDFEARSEGSDSESSSTSSDGSGEEDEEQGEAGEDADEDGEGSADGEGSEDEELQEANHPLLQPGAMPRMSRGMIDMVVGMVEEDMAGPVSTTAERGSEDELEEDELDD